MFAAALALASAASLAFAWLQVPRALPGDRPNEVTVEVIGHQGYWEFVLTDQSGQTTHTVGDLALRVGSVVSLVVTSADLVYSFYVPDLHLKVDAIPGLETTTTFVPSQVGDFTIRNVEYAGPQGHLMVATLRVVRA